MSIRKDQPPLTTPPSDLDHHLGSLKLSFIAGHYAELATQAVPKQWSHIDYLDRLVEGEAQVRRDRATKSRIRLACFPVIKTVDQFRWDWPTRLNRLQVQNHFRLEFIKDKSNVILLGGVGLGKTWLGCALGHKACREGLTALSLRLPRFLPELPMAKGDGRYGKRLTTLAKTDVLMLDDWGLAPFRDENRRDLLEIVEDRHDRRATIITSQLPVEHWHDALGDPTLADAILDRLVHKAYKIALHGESMRKRPAKLTRGAMSDEQ